MNPTNSENKPLTLSEAKFDILVQSINMLMYGLNILHESSEFLACLLESQEYVEAWEGKDLTPVRNELLLIHAAICLHNDNFMQLRAFINAVGIMTGAVN